MIYIDLKFLYIVCYMINVFANYAINGGGVLGPLCYKLITIVNCYLETGLACFVYYPKALYLSIFIVWLLL